MLKIVTKTFEELSKKEQKAIHVLGVKKEQIVAYTRIFKAGDYFERTSIGRVVVAQKERKNKYGSVIMKASIQEIQERFGTTTIEISAQAYLLKFYGSLGFQVISEEYLEDGIPHFRK